MSLRPYPSYKHSGVAWLGQIPSHWWVGRLKFTAHSWPSNVDKHLKDDEHPILLCNYVDVYANDYITGNIEFMQGTATAGEIRNFSLERGDIVITKDSESWNDIAVPAYVSESIDGLVCGYHLSMIRSDPSLFDSRYLFRLFCSVLLNYQFKVEANGVTRFGLPTSAIDNALLLRPPLDEQRAIVEFIDTELKRIDDILRVVGNSEDTDTVSSDSFVGLLLEYRSAVINNAVTGAIDVRQVKTEAAE